MAAPEESPSASVQALRSAHDPTTILVVIAGAIERSDARRLAERVQELLEGQPTSTLICDVAGISRSDAAVVDALCRIRVMALRHGCRVTIQDPPRELEELLYLTGLTNVLPRQRASGTPPGEPGGSAGSGVGPRRQPE